MVNLNDLLQTIISDVDIKSALLLSAAHSIPYFTTSYLETVADAAVDMMCGKNVRAIKKLFSNQIQ